MIGVKEMNDSRAMTDIGSAIFIRRSSDTKYHIWLPVTNIPATGSAPEQVETTVTTSAKKTYTQGRQDSPQKELTFMAHRDNFMRLKEDFNKEADFLQINPDLTAWAFRGFVSMYQDEISVGSNLTGKAVITTTYSEDKPRENVLDIIQETVTINSAVNSIVSIEGTGTEVINIVTDPSTATIEAESTSPSVATVTVDAKTVTITGVASGSTLVKITVGATDCSPIVTYVLVEVK